MTHPTTRPAPPRLTSLPLHPFLLAATIVLHFAVAASVDVHAVVRPFLVAIGAVAIAVLALSLVLRSAHIGGFAVTALLALLLARPFWILNRAVLTTASPWQAALWLALLTVTLLVAGRIAWRASRRWDWPRVTRRLNGFAGALLIVVVGWGLVDGSAAHAMGTLEARHARADAEAAADSPDIIVVLLDGYARDDTLERTFDLDNSPFLDALTRRGFEVSSRSRSNYVATHLTFMSMFHMTHLVDMPEYDHAGGGLAGNDPRVRNLINDNPTLDLLESRGYTTISLAPGVERVTLRSVDTTYDSMQLNEFEYHLLRSSALAGLWSMFDPSFMARQHRERVLDGISRVDWLARQPAGGRFIFAHIISPHMPAIFHRDGSFRPVRYIDSFFQDAAEDLGISVEELISTYRDQVLALNDLVIGMVDTIVRENPEATVIILSDHGSAAHFDPEDNGSDLDERFSTLFAARTPGHRGVFTDGQTTVNVFPRLFNAYFDTNLPLQTDDTYAGVRTLVRVANPDAERDTAELDE